jgi:cytochrome P450
VSNEIHSNNSCRFAGSDTSALARRATFLYVITNPIVRSRLLEKISNVSISKPIKDAEAPKLPYFQVVIKEGLGMFPPVTRAMSKEVPPGGDAINGFFVRGEQV